MKRICNPIFVYPCFLSSSYDFYGLPRALLCWRLVRVSMHSDWQNWDQSNEIHWLFRGAPEGLLALCSPSNHAHWWCVLSHCWDPVQVWGGATWKSGQMLGFWEVVNMVLPERGSPCELPPPVWPPRREHGERSTHEGGMCWMHDKCALLLIGLITAQR